MKKYIFNPITGLILLCGLLACSFDFEGRTNPLDEKISYCVPNKRTCRGNEVLQCQGYSQGQVVVEICHSGYVCQSGFCVEETTDAGQADAADADAGDSSPGVPDNVAEFRATPGSKRIDLSWNSPDDSAYAGVKIVRSPDSSPASPEQGVMVYNGSGLSFTDTVVDSQKTYYYTAFSYNDVAQYSSGVTASAVPFWTIEPVKTTYWYDNMTPRSLAVDSDNRPYVAYGGNHLFLSLYNGVWSSQTVDPATGVGQYAAMTFDSEDRIHISYYDSRLGHLKYATSLNGSWLIQTVDSASDVGQYSSIAVDSLNVPHISYLRYNASGVAYLKLAQERKGAWLKKAITAIGANSKYTGLVLDSQDTSHIIYYDGPADPLENGALMHMTSDNGSWNATAIDTNGDVGQYCAVAIDPNDFIYVSYLNATDKDLKYATNKTGTWVTSTVDYVGDVGTFTSIAFNLKTPDKIHISYRDETNQALKMATLTGTWSKTTVDASSDVGYFSSIATDADGLTHISHYDKGLAALKYSYYNGSAFVPTPFVSKGELGGYAAIALDTRRDNEVHSSFLEKTTQKVIHVTRDQGEWQETVVATLGMNASPWTPISVGLNRSVFIAFHDPDSSALRCAVLNGTAWDVSVVDTGDRTGRYPSLVVDSQNTPHISYYKGVPVQALQYAFYNGSEWVVSTIDPSGDVSEYSGIALGNNGSVHVSYSDPANEDVKYAFKHNGTWVSETIESNVGLWTAIAVDENNVAHVAYVNTTDHILRYATNKTGAWAVLTVNPGVPVGDYSAIAIDSLGYVYISYSTDEMELKYATNANDQWTYSVLDWVADVLLYTAIAIDSDDKVHISYFGENTADLRYTTNAY